MTLSRPLPWSHQDQGYVLDCSRYAWEDFALVNGHDLGDVAEQSACVDTGDDLLDLVCSFDRDRLIDEARD